MGKRVRWVGAFLFIFTILFFLTVDLSDHQEKNGSNPSSQDRAYSAVTGLEDECGAAEEAGPSCENVQEGAPLSRGDIPDPRVEAEAKPFVEHEVLVKFDPKMSREEIDALLNGLGMNIEQVLDNSGLSRVKLPDTLGVEEALEILLAAPEVLFSEPNFLVWTTGTPNDTSFTSQWGLHNTGNTGGTNDADIDAPEAWDKVVGSSSVVVAVVDEGIDLNHPDLAGNIWTNTGEIPGNGLDDDGNGFVDDVNGWDFNHNDASIYDGASEDRHGTQVAGIIGAVGNNGIGTAGICWTVKIMPVKFIAYGSGTIANAVVALDYAVANGAKVINCSWGGTSYSASLKEALDRARSSGVLVVTSAGNSSKDTDSNAHYPSNYDLDNVLSVAATDKNDGLSYFSNYGLTTVDLGAPGSSIYTTKPDGAYSYFSGTSASAPFVAGAAALALSTAPNLTYLELRDQIMNSVDPIDSLTTKTVTGGRLNLNNLVSGLNQGDADGDGLPNGYEIQYGLNPYDASDAGADTDGDGLTNLQEYQNGTSPIDSDTDDDGLPDGYEVAYLLDPLSKGDASLDNDADGLSNLLEYQAGTRIDLADTDADGIDDFVEYGPRNRAADSDGDGEIDALDLDSDNDGKLDADEGTDDDDNDGAENFVDMDDTDGPDGDQDGDGLTNSVEVTFMLYPNLVDSDGDGLDDPTEFGLGVTPLDSDGDGEVDALDFDSDNDGKLDADEGAGDLDGDDIPNYRDSDDSDGPLGDADGDGLLNSIEASYGLNVNLADSDGDGLSDFTEFGGGAEPLDTDEDGLIDALDTDSDNDGALDRDENGMDSDGDGVPDRLENDTATIVTNYGKLSLILPEGKGALGEVAFLAQPVTEASKPNLDFRYGGMQYKITGLNVGESVQVTLQVSSVLPADTEFWKYSVAEGYYIYPAAVSGTTLQFTLTDGEQGDEDLVADGTIIDPAYIGIPIAVTDTGSPAAPARSSGGGSGCALSASSVSLEQGVLDSLMLLVPIVALVMLKLLMSLLNQRSWSRRL